MGESLDWSLGDLELDDLNPEKARALFVEFYYLARKHHEDVAEEDEKLPSEDHPGLEHAEMEIRNMMDIEGDDFDHPTRKNLEKLIPIVIDKVASWGVPSEIFSHYRNELKKIVEKL